MPKSRSGPCRVIATFTPEPLTPAQEHARLLHKRALLTNRLADAQAWNRANPRHKRALRRIHERLSETKIALLRLGEQ